MHKYILKKYYGQTNKKKDFLEQLTQHINRHINILAMNNIIFQKCAKKQVIYKNSVKAMIIRITQDFIIFLTIGITLNIHDI